jgi:hypothetical protein
LQTQLRQSDASVAHQWRPGRFPPECDVHPRDPQWPLHLDSRRPVRAKNGSIDEVPRKGSNRPRRVSPDGAGAGDDAQTKTFPSTDFAVRHRWMRVILTEGSGLTSRQVAQRLGELGHEVELLSSTKLCLSRFTRQSTLSIQFPILVPIPLAGSMQLSASRHVETPTCFFRSASSNDRTDLPSLPRCGDEPVARGRRGSIRSRADDDLSRP